MRIGRSPAAALRVRCGKCFKLQKVSICTDRANVLLTIFDQKDFI